MTVQRWHDTVVVAVMGRAVGIGVGQEHADQLLLHRTTAGAVVGVVETDWQVLVFFILGVVALFGRVADVSGSVRIHVGLVWVGHQRAVVGIVSHTVAVNVAVDIETNVSNARLCSVACDTVVALNIFVATTEHRRMLATDDLVAQVSGADVVVVADRGGSECALVSGTRFRPVAGVLVRTLIVNVATAGDRCGRALVVDALFGRTDIRVHAVVCRKTTTQNQCPRTDVVSTPVIGAWVVVMAVACCQTTSGNHWVLTHPILARIVSTRVGVVAGHGLAHTPAIRAHVTACAEISVIAGVAIDDTDLALTGVRVAGVGSAWVSGGRAGDLGGLVDHTDHLLADERAIAQIAILQLVAVFIRLALAGDNLADACLVQARVIDCAWIAVIAGCGVRCEHARTGITRVVRAEVSVVAIRGRVYYLSGWLARVCGTRVSIVDGYRRKHTAFGRVARVRGAQVFVRAHFGSRYALAAPVLFDGAFVAIIKTRGWSVRALSLDIARIHGIRVGIIAVFFDVAAPRPRIAVVLRAGIAVVADHVCVYAQSRLRVAHVVCARVAVVAHGGATHDGKDHISPHHTCSVFVEVTALLWGTVVLHDCVGECVSEFAVELKRACRNHDHQNRHFHRLHLPYLVWLLNC